MNLPKNILENGSRPQRIFTILPIAWLILPIERPKSRDEFKALLECFDISEAQSVVYEKYGHGVQTADNGDRLVIAWEAHTEYYSYQVWHIPKDRTKPLEFGPITFPQYQFPLTPLGLKVNALDILICPNIQFSEEELKTKNGRPSTVWKPGLWKRHFSNVANFTPDDYSRERYCVYSSSSQDLLHQLPRLIDTLVAIENYTHLILLSVSSL